MADPVRTVDGYEKAAHPRIPAPLDIYQPERRNSVGVHLADGSVLREMADRMVKIRPGLPVLFMSGYTDDAIVQYGVLEPGGAYIAKPFTGDSLGQKVREIIGPRRVSRATSRIGE